eukprot:1157874-Pelagomonas_calceolata.AAC.6
MHGGVDEIGRHGWHEPEILRRMLIYAAAERTFWQAACASSSVLTMKPGEVQGYEETIHARGLMWQVETGIGHVMACERECMRARARLCVHVCVCVFASSNGWGFLRQRQLGGCTALHHRQIQAAHVRLEGRVT